MSTIFLGLGSNKGDRSENLKNAIDAISEAIGEIEKASSVFKTAAWGVKEQDDFYNQVISLHTSLDPVQLLQKCQKIESDLGRTKAEKWGPRIIDIDILFFNAEIINNTFLSIPHPFLHKRNFVLFPLAQIAANFVHPGFNKNITELLEESQDELKVEEVILV